MYLVDTNIWLELLLEQKRGEEVKAFLNTIESKELYIIDFTIYSIGIILLKLKNVDALNSFLSKVVIESGVNKVILDDIELLEMLDDEECKGLDFDDSYQYYAAKKSSCKILSFDSDFDKTKSGRLVPSEIIKK